MLEKKIEKLTSSLHTFLRDTREVDHLPQKNDLLNLTDKLSQKVEHAVSQDKILRIGVVGQVKAGKSSFINALLFDGKDVLPKASTPMTAALTVIKYSQTLRAEVEFYSKADWEIVTRNAHEFERIVLEIAKQKQAEIEVYNKQLKNKLHPKQDIYKANTTAKDIIATHQDIFDEAKRVAGEAYGAYELLELAHKENLDFTQYIGTTQTIDENIQDISDLVGKLHEHVGANGTFTPITRNITLYLNIETLKDIELVDTPGVNDPIVSRGMATRDFLSQCDTVFLLSTSSQFMGREDTEFLVNTLPAEGITNIILLGSKFDSVLVDEFKKYNGDIIKAIKDIYQKLSNQANRSLKAVIDSNPNKPIMEKIKNKEVKFISGICYNIAKKGRTHLDEMEKHALDLLEKRYEIAFDDNLLFQLANIDRIRTVDLETIKSQKDEILAHKLSDLIVGQSHEFTQKLGDLSKALNAKITELDKVNVNELRKRAHYIEVGLNKARSGVKQIFIDLSLDIAEDINKLLRVISDRKSEYLGIKVDTKSKEESYREYVGTRSRSTWYKFWTWGDKEDVYETRYRTVNYNVANVIDAAENASMFVRLINEEVSQAWSEIVNIQAVEKKLIQSALNGFDMEDENYDKNAIINPVKNALRAIQIQPLQLKDREYRDQIANSFSSSEVKDDDIYALKRRVSEVIERILDAIEEKLTNSLEEINDILSHKGESFIDSIKEHSNKEIAIIEEDLKNIDDAKRRYSATTLKIAYFTQEFEELHNVQ